MADAGAMRTMGMDDYYRFNMPPSDITPELDRWSQKPEKGSVLGGLANAFFARISGGNMLEAYDRSRARGLSESTEEMNRQFNLSRAGDKNVTFEEEQQEYYLQRAMGLNVARPQRTAVQHGSFTTRDNEGREFEHPFASYRGDTQYGPVTGQPLPHEIQSRAGYLKNKSAHAVWREIDEIEEGQLNSVIEAWVAEENAMSFQGGGTRDQIAGGQIQRWFESLGVNEYKVDSPAWVELEKEHDIRRAKLRDALARKGKSSAVVRDENLASVNEARNDAGLPPIDHEGNIVGTPGASGGDTPGTTPDASYEPMSPEDSYAAGRDVWNTDLWSPYGIAKRFMGESAEETPEEIAKRASRAAYVRGVASPITGGLGAKVDQIKSIPGKVGEFFSDPPLRYPGVGKAIEDYAVEAGSEGMTYAGRVAENAAIAGAARFLAARGAVSDAAVAAGAATRRGIMSVADQALVPFRQAQLKTNVAADKLRSTQGYQDFEQRVKHVGSPEWNRMQSIKSGAVKGDVEQPVGSPAEMLPELEFGINEILLKHYSAMEILGMSDQQKQEAFEEMQLRGEEEEKKSDYDYYHSRYGQRIVTPRDVGAAVTGAMKGIQAKKRQVADFLNDAVEGRMESERYHNDPVVRAEVQRRRKANYENRFKLRQPYPDVYPQR